MLALSCGPRPASPAIETSPSQVVATDAPAALHGFWWSDLNWTADQRQGRVPEIPREPIVSTTLAMGRLDGTPTVELRRDFTNLKPFVSFRSLEPFARRVEADGIVFGYFDGAGSVVEWVDASSGQSETIFASDRPIHNVVLSSDRKTLYAVLLDARDHTEAGVWSFDVTEAKPVAVMLARPRGFDPENEGLVENSSSRQMSRPSSCVTASANVASGLSTWRPASFEPSRGPSRSIPPFAAGPMTRSCTTQTARCLVRSTRST